jgi:hypothetical protein
MKLADYLYQQRLTPTEFRRILGVPNRSTFQRYLHGEHIPRPRTLQKIIDSTDGQVALADFLDPTPPDCALIRHRPDGSTRWVLPWSPEYLDENGGDDEHDDRFIEPVHRALFALGTRAKELLSGIYEIDGRRTDTRGLVAAANRVLRSHGQPTIRYPGVENGDD